MRKIQRNGVGLAYVEFGEGHPPIVFVHGWCCDHTFLEPQLAYFERRHRVIGVDLRVTGPATRLRGPIRCRDLPRISHGCAASYN